MIDYRQIEYDVPDQYLSTPFLYSTRYDFRECQKELLKKNVNINQTDDRKRTPIVYAIINKNYDLVDKLLAYEHLDLNIHEDDSCILHYLIDRYTNSRIPDFDLKETYD